MVERFTPAKPGASSYVTATARLRLREASLEDAAFFLELLNDPSWIENIGDRGIRTLEGAAHYVTTKVCGQYALPGCGMYLLELREGGTPIGICGLVRRDFLDAPDLGFALLPAYAGRGLATEAAEAVLARAAALGVRRLHAFTRPGNVRSWRLLERLGFKPTGVRALRDGELATFYEWSE